MASKKSRSLAAELSRIEKKNGRLRADDVIKAASDPKNPLHKDPRWHWDNPSKAIMEYRRSVARDMIASVRVEITYEDRVYTFPQWLRDPKARPQDQGYVAMSQVRRSKGYSEEALTQEAGVIMAAMRRYRDIATTLNAEKMVLKVISDFERAHQKLLAEAVA